MFFFFFTSLFVSWSGMGASSLPDAVLVSFAGSVLSYLTGGSGTFTKWLEQPVSFGFSPGETF